MTDLQHVQHSSMLDALSKRAHVLFVQHGEAAVGSAKRGPAVAGHAPIQTMGRAPIQAMGHAPVRVAGHAPIQTMGHAPIQAMGHAPVRAAGHAPIQTIGHVSIQAMGHAHKASESMHVTQNFAAPHEHKESAAGLHSILDSPEGQKALELINGGQTHHVLIHTQIPDLHPVSIRALPNGIVVIGATFGMRPA
jgi:hypothetical protein